MRFFREGRTAAVAFEKMAGTPYHGVPTTCFMESGVRVSRAAAQKMQRRGALRLYIWMPCGGGDNAITIVFGTTKNHKRHV